jgi:hypothetical protein
VRLQVLHSLDYRRALSNASSPEERRRGRDLSRAIAHDVPVARDLAGNLLDTVDRLSAARDPGATAPGPVAAGSEAPPAPPALPLVGLPPPSAAPAAPRHATP